MPLARRGKPGVLAKRGRPGAAGRGPVFAFGGGGERGVNPHLSKGLLHLLKSPARFSFSRNMTRAKVHPWRIANMRGIDGEQKFRLCWFGNLSPGFAHSTF
jgi:hypothetical protein